MNFRRILQLGLLVVTAFPSFSRILINEIHYDPPVKTELTEFIELHNSGAAAVDLSGWAFTAGVEYNFPAGTTIPAGGYLVVAENPGAFQARFGTTALGPFVGLLANDGETISLRNAQGQVEDEVDYQLGFPWPTVGELPGYSIELINPSFDNDLGGNWRRSLRGNAPAQTQVLIPRGSTWNYVKGTAEPSSPINGWRALTFNDSSWQPGPAPIGFDGDLTMGTPLSDMRYNYTSFYMRKKFQVSDPAAIGSLNVATLYDDGVQVWINGQRVVNAQMPDRDVAHNEVATGLAREGRDYDVFTINSPASFLRAGENLIAVQAHNVDIGTSSDAYADVELSALIGPTGAGPTPGARNAVYDTNAPPQMRQVDHSPEQPRSGDPVKITVKITDNDGVASARVLYQVVDPGNYIDLTDVAYETTWTPVTMVDNGTNGDEWAGDAIYTATLPGSLQTHRRLVRYRIEATDGGNRTIRAPYSDDPSPNFAYFV
ncbi:MAG: lamin tail domain-containing protein, partial [Limisphaerales bacterium]